MYTHYILKYILSVPLCSTYMRGWLHIDRYIPFPCAKMLCDETRVKHEIWGFFFVRTLAKKKNDNRTTPYINKKKFYFLSHTYIWSRTLMECLQSLIWKATLVRSYISCLWLASKPTHIIFPIYAHETYILCDVRSFTQSLLEINAWLTNRTCDAHISKTHAVSKLNGFSYFVLDKYTYIETESDWLWLLW